MRPPRQRPPWWPADEPWPPQRWPPAGWTGPRGRRGMTWEGRVGPGGGHFLVRMLLGMAGFLLLSVAFVLLLGYLGAAVLGIATPSVGSVIAGILVVVGLAAALGFAFRSLRRAGRPFQRLIDAAGRVEAGDYSVRVPEDGPPDLRSVERAFNGMSARLEAGDRARRTFLADVSHELRTPLTVIRGQLEAIADGVYPSDATHLEPVLAQTAALERLVDDLRTVALAEAGALPLHREPVDLAALAAAVVADLAPAATSAAVTLAAEPAGAADLPPVAADPALLRRVLVNLITNALRHTPAGGAVRLAVTAPDAGHRRLTVSDTGTGIAADLLPRVFDRFAKGPDSDGTGLGLSIARDIVVAHGGSIAAESAPGAGTRIVIDLPVVPGSA